MKLITPAEWRERYFSPTSAQPEPTLRRWLQTGAVPGRKIGGTWFIDDHAW